MDVDRRRILRWLEAKAPALAPVYDGAVRMTQEPEFPGRVHFVAHAIREIMNRLPDAIDNGGKSFHRTNYTALVNNIDNCWKEGKPPTADCRKEVEVLLQEHQTIDTKNRDKAQKLYRTFTQSEPSSQTIETWTQTRKSSEKRVHVRNKPMNSSDDKEIVETFEELEKILQSLLSRLYEDVDELE